MIVGSQAILGAVPEAPEEVLRSQEVDLYAPDDEQASDLVDGSIGEKSPFHETFGYYAHGVGPETAILPSRWRERAVTVGTAATGGVIGICPQPADLAISKLAAGRDKDRHFASALLRHGLITIDELHARLDELDPTTAEAVRTRIRALSAAS